MLLGRAHVFPLTDASHDIVAGTGCQPVDAAKLDAGCKDANRVFWRVHRDGNASCSRRLQTGGG